MTFDSFQSFWSSQTRKVVIERVALMAIGGVILGTITPYGTSNIASMFGRYLYWLGCVMVPGFYAGYVGQMTFPFLKGRIENLTAVVLIYTSAFTLPTFVWVASWEVILHATFSYQGDFWDCVHFKISQLDFTFFQYLAHYMRVWVISLVLVGAIGLFVGRKHKADGKADAAKVEAPFLDRLSAELGRDLLCLSMEDHYVRAHTDKGDTLILMRMADAVKELETYGGAQVHRSWWVAKDAVASVEKEQRKVSLTLKNGLTVPVSHRRVKALKEEGFL